MFSLMWMAWTELRSHPMRSLFTLASVAIGVGAVVAIHCASSSARQAFSQLHSSLTGDVDFEIVANDGSRFARDDVSQIDDLPGIAAAFPQLRRATLLYANGSRVATQAVGIDAGHTDLHSRYRVVDGRLWGGRLRGQLAGSDETADRDGETDDARTDIVLEAQLAGNLGIEVGTPVSFLMPRGPTRCVVIGLIALHSPVGLADRENVFFRLGDLQQVARLSGQVDQLRIRATDDAALDDLRSRLSDSLPEHLVVRKPMARTDLADATLSAVDQGLKFAQAIALVMAVFIIINTFLISVTQRYRQWGVLRAVGATQRQVFGLVVSEALVIGLAGSLIGLAAGVWSARFLGSAIGRVLSADVTSVVLDPKLVAAALALGPLLAVLGCFVPARKACHVSPIETLRGDLPYSQAHIPWYLVILAAAVWFVSFIGLIGCAAELLPAALAIPAGLGMMLGFVLMIPPLLPLVARLLTKYCLAPIWPCESQLAQDHVFQSRLRTALTIAVVVVALANVIGLGHELLNSVGSVRDWYHRMMFADLVLTPDTSEGANEFGLRDRDSCEHRLSAIEGVNTVQTLRFVTVRADDQPAVLVSRSFAGENLAPWRLPNDSWAEISSQISAGAIVVGSVLARHCNVVEGDQLRVEYGGRVQQFPVAAIVTDYNYGGHSLYVDREVALRQLGVDGVSAFLVSLAPATREATSSLVEAVAQANRLTVFEFADLRTWLDQLMNGVVSAFWVVLGLGLVVAAFGIFNTITMNVLEQSREIGLLRIVGMTRPQVLRTVLAQGVILALLGVVLGTLAGLVTAYFMHLCKGPVLGSTTEFHWRPTLIIFANVVAFALVLMASYAPARRAAHLDMLQSVQEDS